MMYEAFEDGTMGLGDPTQNHRFSMFITHPDPAGMHGEQLRFWLYACDEADLILAAIEGFTASGAFERGTEFHVVANTEEASEELLALNNNTEGMEPLMFPVHVAKVAATS
jgi:hypothetical protein